MATYEDISTTLPLVRSEDGDVFIKVGDNASDWLLVQSNTIRATCPTLASILKPEWATPKDVIHPATGAKVSVVVLHLRFVDSTFVLSDQASNAFEDEYGFVGRRKSRRPSSPGMGRREAQPTSLISQLLLVAPGLLLDLSLIHI